MVNVTLDMMTVQKKKIDDRNIWHVLAWHANQNSVEMPMTPKNLVELPLKRNITPVRKYMD